MRLEISVDEVKTAVAKIVSKKLAKEVTPQDVSFYVFSGSTDVDKIFVEIGSFLTQTEKSKEKE